MSLTLEQPSELESVPSIATGGTDKPLLCGCSRPQTEGSDVCLTCPSYIAYYGLTVCPHCGWGLGGV